MIAHLRGRLVRRGIDSVVVDVHGVGYLIHVPVGEAFDELDQVVELHTSLQVREDSMTLYGFRDPSSLALFELLLTSSGVGPRLALAAIGTHHPETLWKAIASGDTATLIEIPGVGKKVAERLVLDLQDKVSSSHFFGGASAVVDGGPSRAVDAVKEEVAQALSGLGYSSNEIQRALGEVGETEPSREASDVLRSCLRFLATGQLEGFRR